MTPYFLEYVDTRKSPLDVRTQGNSSTFFRYLDLTLKKFTVDYPERANHPPNKAYRLISNAKTAVHHQDRGVYPAVRSGDIDEKAILFFSDQFSYVLGILLTAEELFQNGPHNQII